jgi:hypothetical protein
MKNYNVGAFFCLIQFETPFNRYQPGGIFFFLNEVMNEMLANPFFRG